MRDILILCVLIGEVVALCRIDHKVYGTWLTPFNLLACPYTAVVAITFLLAPSMGFVTLYMPSVLIWIVGLFVFWCTGLVIALMLDVRTTNSFGFRCGFRDNHANDRVTWFAIALLPLMAINLYRAQAVSGGWLQLGTVDFKAVYEHGILAHTLQMATVLCVFLLGVVRRGERLKLLTIISLLAFLLCSQVKGTILNTLIAAFIFRGMCYGKALSGKMIVLLVFSSFALFNILYVGGMSLADSSVLFNTGTYAFVARHYMYYFWSGVLAFGEALRTHTGTIGGPWYLLLAPFINIYRELFGSGPILVAGGPVALGMSIDVSNVAAGAGTNVFTMMGTMYYYLGPCGGILGIIILSCLSNLLLVTYRMVRNEWMAILYASVGSWLALGFFEYYFASLAFPETAADCVVLYALCLMVRDGR